MPTLILSSRFTQDSFVLERAAKELGWRVERLTSRRVPDELRGCEEPVAYVEASLGPALNEAFGLHLAEPPDDWLPSLDLTYRKREVVLADLGRARTMPWPYFLKPPNDKCFAARVCQGPDDLPVWFPDEQPVLLAEVVDWEKEFRCFALDGKVRTASVYRRDGLLQFKAGYAATDEEMTQAVDFAEEVLRACAAPAAVVLDIGVIRDRGWAAVELNAAWGSGIYGCDPAAVLDVLRHAGK